MISLRQALMLEGQGVVSLVGAGGKTSLMFKLAQEISRAGQAVLTTTTTKILEPLPAQSDCVIVSESVETIVKKARDLIQNKALHITVAAKRGDRENKLIGMKPQSVDIISKKNLFDWILVEADGAAGRPLKVPADHEPVIPVSTTSVIGLVGLSGVGQPVGDKWIHRLDHFSSLTGLASGQKISSAAVCNVLTHNRGIFKDTPGDVKRLAFLNQADAAGGLDAGKQICDLLAKQKKTKLKRIIIGQLAADPPVLEYYDMGS